jgi:hypothetical protein
MERSTPLINTDKILPNQLRCIVEPTFIGYREAQELLSQFDRAFNSVSPSGTDEDKRIRQCCYEIIQKLQRVRSDVEYVNGGAQIFFKTAETREVFEKIREDNHNNKISS